MIKSVDQYIINHNKWQVELETLRKLLLSAKLTETIKWSSPVYTVIGKNLVGMCAFKNYFGLWFFQGALLKDKEKVLINAQEGKTKALRQWRFNSIEDINEQLITHYIAETISNQKQGKIIKPAKPITKFNLPNELTDRLNSDGVLHQAFAKLTPFKQKEFAEYIAQAKRDATKTSRIEKIKPMILANIGLNDKYR